MGLEGTEVLRSPKPTTWMWSPWGRRAQKFFGCRHLLLGGGRLGVGGNGSSSVVDILASLVLGVVEDVQLLTSDFTTPFTCDLFEELILINSAKTENN